jgi:hypothetical protein
MVHTLANPAPFFIPSTDTKTLWILCSIQVEHETKGVCVNVAPSNPECPKRNKYEIVSIRSWFRNETERVVYNSRPAFERVLFTRNASRLLAEFRWRRGRRNSHKNPEKAVRLSTVHHIEQTSHSQVWNQELPGRRLSDFTYVKLVPWFVLPQTRGSSFQQKHYARPALRIQRGWKLSSFMSPSTGASGVVSERCLKGNSFVSKRHISVR